MSGGAPREGESPGFPAYSELTFTAEGGGRPVALRPYWPRGASGVTLGPGYDMKERDAATVVNDLVGAGVAPDVARRMSAGAGLQPDDARDWVTEHRKTFEPISVDVSRRLFLRVYPAYVARAQRTVKAWGGDWHALTARAQEVLVDLAFRGDLSARHRNKLRPAVVTASEAALRDALADYVYWQAHTNLPPRVHGPNERLVQRAVFLGAGGAPGAVPPSPHVPDAVSRAPADAHGVNAMQLGVGVRIAVLDAFTGQPVPYATTAVLTVNGQSSVHRGVTDAQGVLTVPVPAELLARPWDLKVGFHDFAVVAEASRHEADTHATASTVYRDAVDGTVAWPFPGMTVAWQGPQQGIHWGWRVRRPAVENTAPAAWAEFMTELSLPVPAMTEADGWRAVPPASSPFSMHHARPGACEFVLFALRFTPPVQFTPPETASHAIAGREGRRHLPLARPAVPGMYMITRFNATGGTVAGGGRDFGTLSVDIPAGALGTRINGVDNDGTPLWRNHYGVDLAGAQGTTPVFACTAGTVNLAGVVGGYGNLVAHTLEGGFLAIYGHLHHPATVTAGSHVRAGQHLGWVGRTGYEGSAETPTHLHFEISRGLPRSKQQPPRIEPATWLEHVGYFPDVPLLPHNEMPRLFPCDCDPRDGKAVACLHRGGAATDVAHRCWAARTRVCPYTADTP